MTIFQDADFEDEVEGSIVQIKPQAFSASLRRGKSMLDTLVTGISNISHVMERSVLYQMGTE